jgi:hypothetical protein
MPFLEGVSCFPRLLFNGSSRAIRFAESVSVFSIPTVLLRLFLAPIPSLAQLYAGTVTGVVSDSSGGVVPGANVALVDEQKGYSFTGVTDQDGRYSFRSVPPGTYALSVMAKGFQTQQKREIRVDVSQNVSIDISLTVGATTETIDVNASTVQLQTEDAVSGQVVNRKCINDLPLIDRGVFDLASLAPGVVPTNIPGSGSPINLNSNGSSSRAPFPTWAPAISAKSREPLPTVVNCSWL